MAVEHCVWGTTVSPLSASHHQDDHYSSGTPSSSSTRSSMTSAFNFADIHASSPLLASKDSYMDNQAKARLPEMLKSFIIYRCSLNEHCSEMDFDHTALEALSRMPFLQALQTVEHFSASVSSRIQKKSAYLMGILRGQEAHWDKFLIANGLNVVGSNNMEASSLKGRQILEMPTQLLHFIGDCCLRGNSLPSDFTPEVCLSLHSLTVPLATKAVSAFNTNKRIIAGPKGGVINRARFFLRLIQNVSEQSSTSSPSNLVKTQSADISSTRSKSSDIRSVEDVSSSDNTMNALCAQLAESSNIGHPSPKSNTELNLEQLAELDFHFDQGHGIAQTIYSKSSREDQHRIRMLEDQLALRQQREQMLVLELTETKHRLRFLQTECMKMRSMLGYN